MVTTTYGPATLTLGHVAVYARDGRWRRTMASSLEKAGHSHQEAASPEEIHRLLLSQRFDVLALKVRDEQDAREVAEALDGLALPPHGILVGRGSAQLLTLRPENDGILRYVPGPLAVNEVSHLVEVSMNAGTWQEERITESASDAQIEEVEIEEVIESAASAVYALAKRKRQRFRTVVEGPVPHVLADPAKLRRAVVTLLRLSVTLAPRGALVSVEARAGREEWSIRIRAAAGRGRVRAPAQLAESLREETRMLAAVSRDIQQQGGLLWVELLGPGALALCLTLPLPAGEERSAPAVPSGLLAHLPPAAPFPRRGE
jgi:CheY-like chemotaxis protein